LENLLRRLPTVTGRAVATRIVDVAGFDEHALPLFMRPAGVGSGNVALHDFANRSGVGRTRDPGTVDRMGRERRLSEACLQTHRCAR